jgi:hypothetical protein
LQSGQDRGQLHRSQLDTGRELGGEAAHVVVRRLAVAAVNVPGHFQEDSRPLSMTLG